VPDLADKNLKAFGDAVAYATLLELFQFDAEANEIINAARDETLVTGKNPDVRAVFTEAARKVNEAQAKAKAALGEAQNCTCRA
jgi:GTPase SAR1 family protein